MKEDITALRSHLFAAIRSVKDGSMDLDKARAINEIGKTLVDTAKVEVDYLRATGGGESPFLEEQPAAPILPAGVVGRTVHQIK